MHPDYVGYVVEKRKIHARAKWHDIKFLLRKLVDIELHHMRVEWVDYNDWTGWLVSFAVVVDIPELSRNIACVSTVARRAVFIGVDGG